MYFRVRKEKRDDITWPAKSGLFSVKKFLGEKEKRVFLPQNRTGVTLSTFYSTVQRAVNLNNQNLRISLCSLV